ncbi:AraC family transcriptional regulator [uncultured Limnohabitans sp.]|uniref:helix-turn-helix transcriptional regulator n=1 Tax=uncultured Limnohabitans sp. TaxID=768543 RepID=UPI002618E0C8|nr:AraC family transcriptional regulator [uncultured Limnohabitans sp.]
MIKPRNEDFASSVMVRVLLQGMSGLGLRLPEVADQLTQATVPLDLKREVVQSAVEQAGFAVLPLLGRGLHKLAMDPTHLALTAGRSATSLFVRWQRLERYIHSKHRIQWQGLTPTFARVKHAHKDNGPAPLAAEDLVVCGVLCALLEANGLHAIKATAADMELYPSPDSTQVLQCVQQCQTHTWLLTWQDTEEKGLDLSLPVSWAQVAPPTWSQFACAVGDHVARCLPELVSVGVAAAALGMPSRTFQRTLAAESLSYQRIQSDVRFRLAGWYLLESEMAIAEIGFVCGYSDQAHLTREFNRRMGVPPARYRELFSST